MTKDILVCVFSVHSVDMKQVPYLIQMCGLELSSAAISTRSAAQRRGKCWGSRDTCHPHCDSEKAMRPQLWQ